MSYEIPLEGMDVVDYTTRKLNESFRRHAELRWDEAEAIERRMGDPTLDEMWGRSKKHGKEYR